MLESLDVTRFSASGVAGQSHASALNEGDESGRLSTPISLPLLLRTGPPSMPGRQCMSANRRPGALLSWKPKACSVHRLGCACSLNVGLAAFASVNGVPATPAEEAILGNMFNGVRTMTEDQDMGG